MDNEKTLDLKQGETTPSEDGQTETQTESTEEVKTESADDKVVLSKEEHAKLLEERDNYKKGLLSYKEKAKDVLKDDVLTKTDFQKINEKKAIESFVKENPEVDGKWSEFISYYRDSRGRNDVDSIVKDLDDAKTLYIKHHPLKESDNKETRSDLSSDTSLKSSPRSEGKTTEKGGLLKTGTPITDWYKGGE